MEYIYVMGSTAHPFRYKIGISKKPTNRKKNISESLGANVYIILCVKIHAAFFVEQTLHGIYRPLNAKMKGSGKTEWFWFVFPITPIVLILTAWILQYAVMIGCVFGFIYFLAQQP